MTPEDKAQEYLEKPKHGYDYRLLTGHEKDMVKSAYLAGFNADRWIPVSEGLPEEDISVNVAIKFGKKIFVTTGKIHFEQGHNPLKWICGYSSYQLSEIIAWQPLPSPPNQKV